MSSPLCTVLPSMWIIIIFTSMERIFLSVYHFSLQYGYLIPFIIIIDIAQPLSLLAWASRCLQWHKPCNYCNSVPVPLFHVIMLCFPPWCLSKPSHSPPTRHLQLHDPSCPLFFIHTVDVTWRFIQMNRFVFLFQSVLVNSDFIFLFHLYENSGYEGAPSRETHLCRNTVNISKHFSHYYLYFLWFRIL